MYDAHQWAYVRGVGGYDDRKNNYFISLYSSQEYICRNIQKKKINRKKKRRFKKKTFD